MDRVKAKTQIESCEQSIKETITYLSNEGQFDTGLFKSLLDAKDDLERYYKENDIGNPFLT